MSLSNVQDTKTINELKMKLCQGVNKLPFTSTVYLNPSLPLAQSYFQVPLWLAPPDLCSDSHPTTVTLASRTFILWLIQIIIITQEIAFASNANNTQFMVGLVLCELAPEGQCSVEGLLKTSHWVFCEKLKNGLGRVSSQFSIHLR